MSIQEPATHQLALLVEGDAKIERALRKILMPQGWEIVLSASNADALEQVKVRQFGLIVTAGRTTGVADVELLRKMRKIHSHTRMIIVTDESAPQDVLDSMREQAFSYFAEPFSMDAFENIVKIAVSGPCWDDGIEVASATPDWINLQVRCDPHTADRLLQFMGEIADLPEKEGREAGGAFREVLLNAMEHGGHFDPEEYVEISYVRTRKMVTCRIKDPGKGFSLQELKHSALANPPGEPLRHALLREEQGMRPGGYGVLLARHLVDELLYNEKGNEVFLVKYLDRARPWTGSAQSL
jgi:anti-sigma regulatory factor (Ser/Thr protein kinase)/ActR/RegA family two-component response regulator